MSKFEGNWILLPCMYTILEQNRYISHKCCIKNYIVKHSREFAADIAAVGNFVKLAITELVDSRMAGIFIQDVACYTGALHTDTETRFTGSGFNVSRVSCKRHADYTLCNAGLDLTHCTVPEQCHAAQRAPQIRIKAKW